MVGYLREGEYDDAHSQTHDNQAGEEIYFKEFSPRTLFVYGRRWSKGYKFIDEIV